MRFAPGTPRLASPKTSAGAVDSQANPAHFARGGPMAEWLRRGLQILARRFDSGSGLQI